MSRRRCGSPAPRAHRVRVPVAVLEIVGFTTVAHAAAGGELPRTGHMLAVAAAMTLVAVALRQSMVRLPLAAAGAAVAQVALHTAFSYAPSGEHAAHQAMSASSALDPAMLLAHAAGAVVTAMALAWQEQVLVGLVRRFAPRHWDVVELRTPRRVDAAGPLVTRVALRALSAAPRRGPPSAALA